MKVKILIGFFLALACFLMIKQYAGRRVLTIRDLESEIGLSLPSAREYRVHTNILRKDRLGAFRSLEAARGRKLLKIHITTGLSGKKACQTMEERLFMVQSLYSNLPSPYPGMVTNTITVADALKPRIRKIKIGGVMFPLYILSSNARFTYGAMNEASVVYQGGLCFFFNESTSTLYRFDFFIPKEEFDEAQLVLFFSGIRAKKGRLSFLGKGRRQGKQTSSPPREVKKESRQVDDTLQFKDYNLILIALEPLGANHVSSYGYEKKTTPNLDAFAENAFLFQNAVSPSSWSLPSFMSWFTSLYPSQHKVTNKYSAVIQDGKIPEKLSKLSLDVSTMAQVFRKNGYRTAGFTGGASLSHDFGFNRGFETYDDKQSFAGFDRTMPKAIDWLSEHKNEKVFLFVQGYDVHGRFPLARQYLKKFSGDDYFGPFKGTAGKYWKLRTQNIEQGRITFDKEDLRLWRAVYDAKIFAADRRFGSFIRKLHKLDLVKNSIIIISSGSGNEYHEHGGIDHGLTLYEELVHVPLIIRIPGHHSRIADLVRTIDIMPTVIDLLDLQAGPRVQKQMQGVSLTPLLAGERLNLVGISETDYLLKAFKRSIKTADGWKLIISLDTEKRELYNLKDDPGEQKNRVKSQGRKAYELEQVLFSHLRGESTPR